MVERTNILHVIFRYGFIKWTFGGQIRILNDLKLYLNDLRIIPR